MMYTDTVDEALRGPAPSPSEARTASHPDAVTPRQTADPSSVSTAVSTTVSTTAAAPTGNATRRTIRRRSRVRVTFSLCLRYRITGLAAEAAFWVLLSLPAFALGTVGVLGYLHGQLGAARVAHLEQVLTNAAAAVLSEREVRQTVAPALHDTLTSGHADVVSVGFLVALWSGSRAMNVAIDTITVASGQSGLRGIVRTRLLAFALYLPALLLGAATVPLMLAGTELLGDITPAVAAVLGPLVWPIAAAALVAFLTTLYHLALPDRRRWREELPGAFVALAMWAAGSAALRVYFHHGGNTGTSSNGSAGAGYGRIAATAAILLWMYITGLAVLIGAVYNAVRAGADAPDHDRNGESAGEKAVEPADAPSENNPETAPTPSLRMTRSSA
jgi:membrane protein